MFSLWRKKKFRILEDVLHSSRQRRVLLSTVVRPFLKPNNFKHSNQTESLEMAAAFHELGYRVDVINYDIPLAIDYTRYDVLFGSGAPFDNLFQRGAERFPRTILYMCGALGSISNKASLRRLQEVHRSRGAWLGSSARLAAQGIGCETMVDGLIVLGNAWTADPYRAASGRPVHELPLFYHSLLDARELLDARDLPAARRHFIWLCGSGLVHKGLDLVLAAFSRHPELHLHVYGDFKREPEFVRSFRHELHDLPNVHLEGYLAVNTPAFRAELLRSAFVILPSCAESCSSAVLNVCGNGGNLPIITEQCGIDLDGTGILIRDTTVAAVEAALLEAAGLGDAELDRRMRASAAFFQREHSLERFRARLKGAIQSLLDAPPLH